MLMRLPWRASTRAQPLKTHIPRQTRFYTITQGDYVLLREISRRDTPPILTKPLTSGKRIDNHVGVIHHDEIIGKRFRDTVAARRKEGAEGRLYRIHEVKLGEWVRLTQRLVTPIYPADANLIVELFDIHIPSTSSDQEVSDDGRLEILEAGTGHGALTLYLSRAIHGANPPRPKVDDDRDGALENWKKTRRAIIHTVDKSAKFSNHAASVVAGFRKGLYIDNVDFHVGDVGDWCEHQLATRGEGILSHALLDMPNADRHLNIVSRLLKLNGTLIVFNPSITQISDCAWKVWREKIPLHMENVIELGVNGGCGGREWDMRLVQPKAEIVTQAQDSTAVEGSKDDSSLDNSEELPPDMKVAHVDESRIPNESNMRMVCRPKVGDRISGGGFLGVWKKMK